jgi:hypothetical protein
MWEDLGCAGATISFIGPQCNNRAGKEVGLHRRDKKGAVKMILLII